MKITNIRALTQMPLASIQGIFGEKTAGVVDLLQLQPGSEYLGHNEPAYRVPHGLGIPMRAQGAFSRSDIHNAFDSAVGRKKLGVLLVRSSATDDRHGTNPTYFSPYDLRTPQSIQNSTKLFTSHVESLLDASPDMGALAMQMVGDWSRLPDGSPVISERSISFIADSHSCYRPDEM